MNDTLDNEQSFLDRRAQGINTPLVPTITEADLLGDDKNVPCNFDLFKNLRQQDIDWVSWTPLEKIYQILSPYGHATLIHPGFSYFAIGTSKGSVVIFNYKQFLQVVLLPASECLTSNVTFINTSVDGTHIAASLESGHVFIWDLNSGSRESGAAGGHHELLPILHITEHESRTVTGLDFLSERHTAVVISDDSGNLAYHSGFRKGIWQLSYSTIDLAASSPTKDFSFVSAGYPGTANLPFSDLQPVAVLSGSSISLISGNKFSLCYYEQLKMSVDSTRQVIWSKCGASVCYFSANLLEVLKFKSVRPLNKLIIEYKVKWVCQEPLKKIEWFSSNFIGVLTSSDKFILLSIHQKIRQFETIDLLPISLLRPVEKSLASFSGQVIVLTNYNLQRGQFLSWSDIILRFVQKGAYMCALKSIRYFMTEPNLPLSILRLQTDFAARKTQLSQPLRNLSVASIRQILSTRSVEISEHLLLEIIPEALSIYQLVFHDENESQCFIEQAFEQIPEQTKQIFLSTLVSLIERGFITTVTPIVFSELLKYGANSEDPHTIRLLILNMDLSSMDLNFAVRLCQKRRFDRELIYLWNVSSADYLSPFVDLLVALGDCPGIPQLLRIEPAAASSLIYDYLSFVMTSRKFPTDYEIKPPSFAYDLKLEICYILFNGALVEWPPNSQRKLFTRRDHNGEPAFPYMELLLSCDLKRCLAMLHEILEDSFFDDESISQRQSRESHDFRLQVSRQFVVDLMLDRLKLNITSDEKVHIIVFIFRNLPKYPQFIRVSSQVVERLVSLLCTQCPLDLYNDAQCSLEALVASHILNDMKPLIAPLKLKKFDRVLFLAYKQLCAYSDLLELRLKSDLLEGPDNSVLDVLRFCLQHTRKEHVERSFVVEAILQNHEVVLQQEHSDVIDIFDEFEADLHVEVLKKAENSMKLSYLLEYFRFHSVRISWQFEMLCELFVLLSEKRMENDISDMLSRVKLSFVEYQKILEILRNGKSFYGSIIVKRRMNDLEGVIEDIISFLNVSEDEKCCNELLEYAIETCITAEGDTARYCWSKLFIFLVLNSGNARDADNSYHIAIKRLLDELTRLSCTSTKKSAESIMGEVLTLALESQELILTKVRELAPLFGEIINLADVDQQIFLHVLNIVNQSSFSVVLDYERALQSGWSVSHNDCEVCGAKIWGVGLSSDVFDVWKQAQKLRANQSNPEELTRTSIILFKCHHGFHQKCLRNLGQKVESYECLLCSK
ncbi:LANO_0F06810g1_1 [Lachancea nothofagi CBS 11611]|uniref:LANO_0F06810g1_1 n=1 Tax=Lachancea nothofagi CBS 11611 TaxID=1266666 RepID=A0A1G4K8M8_9SACH|nr:LANO_0F06810g1_1 [Lachancea nothofagi CBS 11611]